MGMGVIAGAGRKVADGISIVIAEILVFLIILIVAIPLARAMNRAQEYLKNMPRERPRWLRRHAIRGRTVKSRGLGL